ncbi:hypothetical protein EBS80_05515, partial [bacterium]|nr:hypothetical protein [bacterium]
MVFPTAVFAAPNQALIDVYASRGDLRRAFDAAENYRAVPNSAAGFLVDLDDWAEQYGWREYETLSEYAPADAPEFVGKSGEPAVGASSYVVLDRTSGQILAAKNAGAPWPVASLTKLMTA